jgi:hypothetical protein
VRSELISRATTSALALGLVALACASDTIEAEGEFGRPIALASGDASPLPRLLIVPDTCAGIGEPGGCPTLCDGPPSDCPAGACLPVVIDTLSPVTALAYRGDATSIDRGCLEVRAAAGALASDPSASALAAAVTRFRFSELPLARVPDAAGFWDWRVGDDRVNTHVGAILGGNLLRTMAVRLTDAPEGASVSFYRQYPGSEPALADQGRAFLPIQFPGQLLGKEVTDTCLAGEEDCDFLGLRFDADRVRSALQPTQIVLDACLAPPPGAVFFTDSPRRCVVTSGAGTPLSDYISPLGRQRPPSCRTSVTPAAEISAAGGYAATLVIATGIPDLVLFADSARRFFGELSALPACASGGVIGEGGAIGPACIDSQGGALYPPGWPAAGLETPLARLRIRSLGLVPGLTNAIGMGPCQRLELRIAALKAQCDGLLREFAPYPQDETQCALAAAENAALLGEIYLRRGTLGADPTAWISTLVLPETHPLAMAVRRDVTPEALQPDGLLGTALLRGTDVILDYTDDNPGIRVACVDPSDPRCTALPSCARGSGAVTPSCCFGLPQNLLVEAVSNLGLYGCCPALSEGARRELSCKAKAEGRDPPCPGAPCSG